MGEPRIKAALGVRLVQVAVLERGARHGEAWPPAGGQGEREASVSDLTPEEYEAVTAAWVERLYNAMASAGCNDVFEDEFPKSVCARFRSDYDVLEAWERYGEKGA